jgi:succinoglycan biosynthesis transport protein ExoP
MLDAPRSRLSEAVRAIRMALRLSDLGTAPKVILVTSSIPDEGKSATAMLLATSSAMSGQKTVLVDCDFRHSSVSEAFGGGKTGLADVLNGSADLAETTLRDKTTGIDVIPAGLTRANPADLLSSQRMRNVVEQLRHRYDFVVIDASPLLPVIDALAVAALVDKILMIVEWNRTPQMSVSDAFKILGPEIDRVAGFVFSKVDYKQLRSYAYGFGSGYGYGKHYKVIDKYYTMS